MALTPGGYAKVYALSLATFFAADLLWLGLVAKPFYDRHLGGLLRAQVLWPAAVAFYLLFLLGLLVFVLGPAVESGSVARAARLGGLYGLITYQTYELTNYALVRDWPGIVVAVDIAWGVALSAGVSAVTTLAARRLLG